MAANHQKEQTMLTQAIDVLSDMIGLQVTLSTIQRQRKEDVTTVVIKQGKRKWKARVEVKPYLTNQSLGAAISTITDAKHQYGEAVLVAPYISSAQADKLREHDVEFFDTAGNAFFRRDGLYVFVTGRKNYDQQTAATKERARAFNQTGLRLIFALLSEPGLESETYRTLARKAGISLGAVNWVMRDLQRFGYLADYGARGRQLTNKKELLKRWVAAYPEQLRPKLLIGRFSTDEGTEWWQNVKLPKDEAFWGGEVGAALITKYLRPQTITLYTETSLATLQAKYRLRHTTGGEVEMLQKFWKFDEWNAKASDVAPPLLIYADLLMTADERNLETAELVYEQYLTRLIG